MPDMAIVAGSGRDRPTTAEFVHAALLSAQLAEAGKVDLDAPVRRYIPWFRVADPEASALITVRHLLNQTSGLTEGAGRGATLAAGMHPLEPAVRALATTGLARPPGAAVEYSNLNYTTLGLVPSPPWPARPGPGDETATPNAGQEWEKGLHSVQPPQQHTGTPPGAGFTAHRRWSVSPPGWRRETQRAQVPEAMKAARM